MWCVVFELQEIHISCCFCSQLQSEEQRFSPALKPSLPKKKKACTEKKGRRVYTAECFTSHHPTAPPWNDSESWAVHLLTDITMELTEHEIRCCDSSIYHNNHTIIASRVFTFQIWKWKFFSCLWQHQQRSNPKLLCILKWNRQKWIDLLFFFTIMSILTESVILFLLCTQALKQYKVYLKHE